MANSENHYRYEEIFSRNIGVISREEQDRLKRGRVTVVGAGGVGGIALIQLARMGVGQIHVIEKDVFEASNLNRQMLSFVSRLNKSKAEAAQETLKDINPEIEVRITKQFITEENAKELLKDTDVIIDATDHLVARVIIHRAAAKIGIPSIWIAVTPPFRGGVMSFTPASSPYEIVLRHPSYKQPLTDEMKEKINALKDRRALHSVQHGADAKWAGAYVNRTSPWAVIAPVANIVGLLASFEAFKFIIQREGLKPVIGPDLIRVNLASRLMVEVQTPAEGSWDNTLL
ncbi:HesA/MoeB/ThiF family protein [Thermoactinomyces mirandus]|uniref:ThiF family adenylyltransferase n=1 Tax=Thermoactinomyces mirandus TaxID=2756294 RepID=A0A7W1XS93_9BACL|nr:ThiF family adenylyltransferase [Thermoactinomyces mirandus]MBA4602125.1 ThiF family adenylyltransferase [Thermoactinomyces mirandus]